MVGLDEAWAIADEYAKRTLRVLGVHDEQNAVELLCRLAAGGPPKSRNPWPRRVWLRERLTGLPTDFPLEAEVGLAIHSFRTAAEERWFDFEVLARA